MQNILLSYKKFLWRKIVTEAKSIQNRAATPGLGRLIRKRRVALGLTLQALCSRADLSVGYLSLVERDKAVPTLATLAQIAAALDSELSYFINTHKPSDAYSPAKDRQRFFLQDSSVVYEAVSSDYAGSEISSYIIHVPPGYVSETVEHEGEEFLFILEGTIKQTLAGEIIQMTVGDSLHFDGATAHSWSNESAMPARILWSGALKLLHQKVNINRFPPMATNENF